MPEHRDRLFPSFDVQVQIGTEGPRWLNVTILRGHLGRAGFLTVHLARDIDARVECAEGFTVFPALGALIGLVVDALIPGRARVVYEAPPASDPPAAQLPR